ncbi:MAG: DUF3536 domain-containing protein [Pseudomonadota bacterium]
MSGKYFCIHGHFYQPPRENPWLGIIEAQPSARPFHDWNERVCRECYAPNARARVMGERGLTSRLINNYEYMSFNFGPTLLSWLEKSQHWTHDRILEADRNSRKRFAGHGSALAQVYNHIIMPLASRRDKLTQIRWGRADFVSRFGREPEGMWLAETAVDLATLSLMAREGIKFTILAPDQAKEIRPLADAKNQGKWIDVAGGKIDPRRAYRVFVDEARKKFIDVFFYDGPVSRAVAYEGLLSAGEWLLGRIKSALGEENETVRLVNLATDGESYGHHFKFGDMALAWVFDHLDKKAEVQPINYGAFLEAFPPEHEVRILENTSWSCAHGVERWRSDCGCSVGQKPGWNQKWRAPLRAGLDWLAGEMAEIFSKRGDALLRDPWSARDDYIAVLLRPEDEVRDSFLALHQTRPLTPAERVEVFTLLESQVMSMFMFTSCGWFFDDISGLEPVQNLKYAARGIDLLRPFGGPDLEAGLLERLALAKSNDPEYYDGVDVYRKMVLPSRMDPSRITAHFALKNIVSNDARNDPVSRLVVANRQRRLSGPGLNAALGEARVRDAMTGREDSRVFLALHQGGPKMRCLTAVGQGLDLGFMSGELRAAVDEVSPETAVRAFTAKFPDSREVALEDLIPEMQGRIVRALARHAFDDFRAQARESLRDYEEILKFLVAAGEPVPETFGLILGLDLADRLARLFKAGREGGELDLDQVRNLAGQAQAWDVSLREPHITTQAKAYMRAHFQTLADNPDQEGVLRLISFIRLARDLGLDLDPWACQNSFYELFTDETFLGRLAPKTVASFLELGGELGFLV